MNRLIYILLPVFLVITGCSGGTRDEWIEASSLNFIASEGKSVEKDVIGEPLAFSAPAPQLIRPLPPDTLREDYNRKPASSPLVSAVPEPLKIALGESPNEGFTFHRAHGVKTLTGVPETTEIKDAQAKAFNPYSINSYSKIQGLPHDDITCFAEDNLGNIWIGTMGGGLIRYDGKHWSYFDKKHGLGSTSVRDIMQDAAGNIWISTWGGGVSKMDGTYTWQYTEGSGIINDFANIITLDSRGDIWISHWDNGISVYDGDQFRHITHENGLPEGIISGIAEDSKGNMWISFLGDGFAMYDGEYLWHYKDTHTAQNNVVMSMEIDSDDNILMGVHRVGLVKFDGSRLFTYGVAQGLGSIRISGITEDSDGMLWLGTWGDGVFAFDGDAFVNLNAENGLANDFGHLIFEDSKGNHWIAQWNKGISRYYGNIFTHYTPRAGFHNDISDVIAGKDQHVWLSSGNGGFMHFDGEKFVHYFHEDAGRYFVNILMQSQSGDLWIGLGMEGLVRYDGRNFFRYDLSMIRENAEVFYLMEDSHNNIWFAVHQKGFVKFDGEEFLLYDLGELYPNVRITELVEDKKGNIWISTFGDGILRFDGDEFVQFTSSEGLPSNYVYTLYVDYLGYMWMGTEAGGLSLYNGDGFVHFTTRDGLSDNFTFSVIQDDEGNIITGNRFGLNFLSAENIESIYAFASSQSRQDGWQDAGILFTHLSYSEGFLGIGANRGAIAKDDRGTIWIGANDRLTAFHPAALNPDKVAPVVVLCGLGLYNETINWSQLAKEQNTTFTLANGVQLENFNFEGITDWYGVPQNLQLAHNNNFLTFHYVGITSRNPEMVRYMYRLDGLDRNWQKPVADNFAHYGNLAPGSYTFRVKAMNAFGYWSDEYQYSFLIMAPWWKTWWAYALYIGFIAMLFILVIKVRERSLVMKNRLLDKEVELARKTIEIKQNILANINHEIRSPLTGIMGYAEILAKTQLDPRQQQYLSGIQDSGEVLKETIHHILEYSKIEAGKVVIKNEVFSLEEIIKEQAKGSGLIENDDRIRFICHIDERLPVYLLGDKTHIAQILYNLLSNAVKFTSKGEIEVRAEVVTREIPVKTNVKVQEPFQVRIRIRDTGIGIDPKVQENLFVPFSQIEVNDTRPMDSTGLGLIISKKLTELLGGTIGVSSRKGEGSEFWFTFGVKAAEKSQKKKASKSSDLDKKPLSILFVEDKKVTQMVIKLMLESMGHKVSLASNGQEAVERVKPYLYDLIFMDIQMPVMDGIAATQKLKQMHPDLPPVVGLSANAFEGAREKYMKLGMDEYLTKPVKEEELGQVIEKVCYGIDAG